MQIVERVRRIFDLGADPVQIAKHLSRNSVLTPSVQARPGLRVPGVWDGFELVVRALAVKQPMKHAARNLMGRLVQAFGRPLRRPGEGLTHLFPTPGTLAGADLTDLGFGRSSAQAIRKVAGHVLGGRFRFDSSNSLEETISRIRTFCDVSESAAQYIAMRAFGEPDAFPASDSRHANMVEKCRPWRAYAAMYLK